MNGALWERTEGVAAGPELIDLVLAKLKPAL